MNSELDKWIAEERRKSQVAAQKIADKHNRSSAVRNDGTPTKFYKRHQYFNPRFKEPK
ncbi:hypothetical protein [uncultured Roseibium sp.]|uniref:hypothetical protein n=1 Tax=uncultured Roseibium sp. TaxID=1936171 RepID=UPI00260AAD6D|nr:hypothetical protein [uncultured Roseibium sp.]